MDNTQNSVKKCFCPRCFLPIDENEKVEIDGENFHKMCGTSASRTCCACPHVPKDVIKFFFGKVFCKKCFHRHILKRITDHTFINWCFYQWKNNAQRDEGLKLCMVGRGASPPLVFMPPPASFRVDAEREAGMQSAESKCHPSLFRLRLRTSAGTYVKEWCHGELARTRPALQAALGAKADILALDVTQVLLPWPPTR